LGLWLCVKSSIGIICQSKSPRHQPQNIGNEIEAESRDFSPAKPVANGQQLSDGTRLDLTVWFRPIAATASLQARCPPQRV
jgi:hypothetical protein